MRPNQSGLTLIEILITIAIVAALAGMGFAFLTSSRERSREDNTRALISAVTTVIEQYGQTTWMVAGKRQQIWDLDNDGYIDGDPAREPGLWPAGLNDTNYTGFIDITGIELSDINRNKFNQIVDGWGRPIRIAYPRVTGTGVNMQLEEFGKSACRIWSEGRDGRSAGKRQDESGYDPVADNDAWYDLTQKLNQDNITSWSVTNVR